MRTLRTSWLVRWIVGLVVASLGMLEALPAFATGYRQEALNRQHERQWAAARRKASGLPAGRTDTPDARLRAKIAAREALARTVADVRPLSASEMAKARGRGVFRNPYFNGTLPWQKSLRDVNLSSGNLFKSFTDVQVAPARGAGLVLQRTYNSNDARIGPFGVGWTHAYDIRMEEAQDVQQQSGNGSVDNTVNDVPRTDFFGGKHVYHRDADGLYSPPPYLYDEMSSDYGHFLVNGPLQVQSDTEKGMDGTVKHFTSVVTKANGNVGNERACDWIEDRYGNRTTLAYALSYTQADGSTRRLLTSVTDPTGRSLTFHWTNFGTTGQPAWRITSVDAPTDPATNAPAYRVTYEYYTGASDAASYLNLWKVHLDADGLDRVTTYTYTSASDTTVNNLTGKSGVEYGLLASVSDPLGHTVSYTYGVTCGDPAANGGNTPTVPWTGTVWVTGITEPAGVDAAGSPRTRSWALSVVGVLGTDGLFRTIIKTPDGSGGMLTDSWVLTDTSVRATGWQINYHVASGNSHVAYDADNNVVQSYISHQYAARYVAQLTNTVPPNEPGDRVDNYTYGPHGNVLTHQVGTDAYSPSSSFPGTDTTAYYNASQYFAKQSATDMNGHTGAMGVGTNTAGNAGDPDANIGDRGQVLWARDAGYADSSSPSYQKQYTYTYNQYGQKATETNLNGVTTQYTYGTTGADTGNLTQVVQDPGSGHLNRTTAMHYDVMGRVTQSVDPKGQESDFTYNKLGQPLTVKSYNAAGVLQETVSYTYDTNGRTLSVTDNRGTTSMAYEAGCDLVASVTDPQTGTTSYTYDLYGDRLTVTLAGGGTWTYAYDQGWVAPKDDINNLAPALTRITDDQGRRVDVAMDATGSMPISARWAQTFAGGTGALTAYAQTDYFYDGSGGYSRGWLTQVKTTWNWLDSSNAWRQRLVSQNAYTQDNAGQRLTNQVTAMTPNGTGAPQYTGGSPTYDSTGAVTNLVQTSRTEQYGYDANDRLTSVNYGDGQTQTYAFDAMGNRTQRVDSVSGTTAYTFDNANRLTGAGGSSYTNDADGNTLTGGSRTNTWDSQNRLTQSATSSHTSVFTYGADGLRRSSQVDSGAVTKYAYDGDIMVREMQLNAQSVLTAAATYLTGPRGMEYRRDDGTGQVRWYVYDGLGSVVGELDPSGNLTAGNKYDVYGALRTGGTGTATTRQGYVGSLGHVQDSETGLVYMRARYYDANVGRFASEDKNKDGNNWFTYCDSNPVNRVDRTGKVSEWLKCAFFLAVIAGIIALCILVCFEASSCALVLIPFLLCALGGALGGLIGGKEEGDSGWKLFWDAVKGLGVGMLVGVVFCIVAAVIFEGGPSDLIT